MKILALIILLVRTTTSDGLTCIASKDTLEVSLRNFNPYTFLKTLQALPVVETIPDGVCQVALMLRYYKQTLSVSFSETLSLNAVRHGGVRFDTNIRPFSTTSDTVTSFLKHVCSEDECEITFIKDHLPWLLKANYSELAVNIIPWITRNTSSSGKNFIELLDGRHSDVNAGYHL